MYACAAPGRPVSLVPGERRALEFKLAKLNKKLDKAKGRGETAKVSMMCARAISLLMSFYSACLHPSAVVSPPPISQRSRAHG